MSKYGPGKRRIMRSFTLGKIALVDVPAQAGADVVLMKRADVEEVDVAAAAMIPLAKAKFVVMTSSDKGHAHLVEFWSYDGSDVFAGSTSHGKSKGEENGHSHPWMVNEDGTVTVGESEGHSHTVDSKAMLAAMARYGAQVARENAERARAEAQRQIEMAARPKCARDDGAVGDPTGGDPADPDAQGIITKDAGDPAQGQMGNSTTTAPSGSAGIAVDQVPELQKRLARAEALASLTDAGKTYMKSLPAAAQEQFLASSEADRTAALAKAVDADPVVYTSPSGESFRKSDDPRMVAMAKRADEAERMAKADRDRARNVELTKRAEDELSHLPGASVAKVALLDAVENIRDEAVRKSVAEILAAADNAAAPAFSTLGVRGAVNKSEANTREGALQAIEKMARELQAKETGLSFAKAYQKALSTPEGAVLYEQAK